MSELPSDAQEEPGVFARIGQAISKAAVLAPPSPLLVPNKPVVAEPDVPYTDDILNTVPYVDEILKPPQSWYSNDFTKHFSEGFRRTWEHAMSPETKKQMQDAGIFNQTDARVRMFHKDILEAIYDVYQATAAVTVGTVEGAIGAGVPRELAGAPLEVFPGGRFTGFPHGIPVGTPSPFARGLGIRPPLDLDAAADLGVFGSRRSDLTAAGRFDPNATIGTAPREVIAEPIPLRGEVSTGPFGGPEPTIPASPRETAATLNPDLFAAHDAFVARKAEVQALIDEEIQARTNHPTAVAAQQYIDETLAKVGGVESRLTNAQRTRVAETQEALYNYLHEDTPAMSFLRKGLVEADEGLRTTGPQVGQAVRDVVEATRPPEVVAPRGATTTINRVPGGYEVVVDTPTASGRVVAPDAVTAEAQATALKAAHAQREAVLTAKTEVEAGRPVPYRINAAGNVSVVMNGERVRLNLTGEERSLLRGARQRANTLDTPEGVARAEADAQAILRKGVERLRTEALPMIEKPGVAVAQARLERQLASTGQLSARDIQREFGVSFSEANRLRDRLIVKNAAKLRELYQRNQSIAADTAKKLMVVGRPEAEAKAAGKLVQALYETHAARFQGEKGSAWQIYQQEAPSIRQGPRARARTGELEQAARGKIRLADPADPRAARALITLFKRADASTFMHETGHDWLERLVRDATDARAPDSLINDVREIRDWLGVREGEVISDAAHEQFARGFERYLMEGTAPSRGLARVFEQFKNWLTEIYRSATSLNVELNDNIRRVFDRMLVPEHEPIIAPEPKPVPDPVAQARATPPHLAETKANDIAKEREAASTQLSAEIQVGRRDARRGEEGTSVSDGGTEDPKTVFRRTVGARSDDNLGEGRTVSSRESETPQGTGDAFAPADKPLVDYEGNIRVENLNTPEDVSKAIIDASGENSGFIEARRGVLADQETIRLAEDMGVDPKTLDKWVIGQAWTAEQIVFARRLLRTAATDVHDLALRVATTTDEGTLLAYAEARQRLAMIQERVSGATAEAGRALRAFRLLKLEGDIKALDAQIATDTGNNLAGLRREARMLSQLELPEAINKLVSRMRNAGWSKMFTEAWLNALVSGPHTHIVNTGTNLGVMLGAVPETAVASAVGRIFRTFGREQGVTAGEIIDRMHGVSAGSIDGMRGMFAMLKDENAIPILDARLGLTNPLENTTHAIPGLVGKIVRTPGRFLSAEDQFFKAVAFQQELNVLARRTAINEGLVGDALASRIEELRGNPTNGMRDAAYQHAQYQTFQNQLGKFGQAISNLANVHPLARFILPFVRTPINLLKYAAERGPLGFLSREVWNNMRGANGAAARDTQIARMAVGNMVALGVGYMALNGLISGGGPNNNEQIMTLRMTGWQPYSFKVGNMWISYQRFDPFASTVGVAADMAALSKIWVTEKDEFGRDYDAERFMGLGAMAIYRNLFDKLSLRGVTGLAQALIDYPQHGKSFVKGLAGSVVPGIVGQSARMLDDLDRETRTVWEAVQGRIPWMREDLMPRRDRWGEPFTAKEWGPLQMKMAHEDPVNRAMLDLGINVDQPRRQINGVDLTEKQYDDYVALSGRMAKKLLDGIVTPQFRTMLPGAQIENITAIIDSMREAAAGQVMAKSVRTDNDLIQRGLDLRKRVLETGHR